MPESLTKILEGEPVVSDALTNEQTVQCPRCEQTYRLGYSDTEWHRGKDWAETRRNGYTERPRSEARSGKRFRWSGAAYKRQGNTAEQVLS